jgi:hypothetical protein
LDDLIVVGEVQVDDLRVFRRQLEVEFLHLATGVLDEIHPVDEADLRSKLDDGVLASNLQINDLTQLVHQLSLLQLLLADSLEVFLIALQSLLPDEEPFIYLRHL